MSRLNQLNQMHLSQDWCREFIKSLPEPGHNLEDVIENLLLPTVEPRMPEKSLNVAAANVYARKAGNWGVMGDSSRTTNKEPTALMEFLACVKDINLKQLTPSGNHFFLSWDSKGDLHGCAKPAHPPIQQRKTSILRNLLSKRTKKKANRDDEVGHPNKQVFPYTEHEVNMTPGLGSFNGEPTESGSSRKADFGADHKEVEAPAFKRRKQTESLPGENFEEMRNAYSHKKRLSQTAPRDYKHVLRSGYHKQLMENSKNSRGHINQSGRARSLHNSSRLLQSHVKDFGSSGDSNPGFRPDSTSKMTTMTYDSSQSRVTGHLGDHVTFRRNSDNRMDENTSFSKRKKHKQKLDINYSFQPRSKEQKEEPKPKDKDKDAAGGGGKEGELKKKKSEAGDMGHRKRHHSHRHRHESGSSRKSKSNASPLDVDFTSVLDVVHKRADELSQVNPVAPEQSYPTSHARPSSCQQSVAHLPEIADEVPPPVIPQHVTVRPQMYPVPEVVQRAPVETHSKGSQTETVKKGLKFYLCPFCKLTMEYGLGY